MSSIFYPNYSPVESSMFPNRAIEGRDPILYAGKEPEIPRRYHNKLREPDRQHIYAHIFKKRPDLNLPDPVKPAVPEEKEPVTA